MEQLQCKICGQALVEVREGFYKCSGCLSEFKKEATVTDEQKKLQEAYELIRKGNFGDAESLCTALLKTNSSSYEAYWVRALAKNGVIFVRDIGDRMVPTCQNIVEEQFLSDADVKNAIELAPYEIAENYRTQGARIEAIRKEWFDIASKEAPYDVFICFKDSDKEHGMDRTRDSEYAQDLYNYLGTKGLNVFFSRVSLMGKVSEHYEPYIYNALKTAKVMIVYGEKAEYFNSTWLRNEWSRFIARMHRENMSQDSLIVAYRGVDPYRIPSALLGGRQGLDLTKPSAFNILVDKVVNTVAKAKKVVTLERKEIKGGQMSKKATTIVQTEIQKRTIGANTPAKLDVSLEGKLRMVKNYMSQEMWQEAQSALEPILEQAPHNGEALTCELLIRTQCKTLGKLKQVEHFHELALLEQILDAADSETAQELLDFFYSMFTLPEDEYYKILETILSYEYDHREANIQSAFEMALSSTNKKRFDLLLQTLDANEVDRYIDLNTQMLSNLLSKKQYQDAKKYIGNILSVNEGNLAVLRVDSEISWITDDGRFIQKFETLLKYAKDPNEYVQYFVDKILEDKKVSAEEAELLKKLLTYYKGDLIQLKTSLLLITSFLIEGKQFEQAAYFDNLILAEDPQCADAWLYLCFVGMQSTSIEEMVQSDTPMNRCRGFDEYCSLVNDAKQKEIFAALKKQQELIAQKNLKQYKMAVALQKKDRISELEKAVAIYTSIADFKDSAEQALACEKRIAELQSAAAEKQLAVQKAKKKAFKIFKITAASAAAIALVVVLLVTLIIPLIRFNSADKLFNEGKFDEAMAIYGDLDGFADSEQRITILNGINQIDASKFEEGIKTILSAGVPVKLTYDMGGGDFTSSEHIRVPKNDTYVRMMPLSTSAYANVVPLAETNVPETNEFTYNTSADFAGIQTPGRNGYRFVEWKLEEYSYQVKGAFELKLTAVWSTKDYVVDYDLAGGEIDGTTVSEYDPEDDAFTLINPTRTGYTFAGWVGTDLSEPTINVTIPTGSYGDRTYTATWTANEYTVTYDTAGGTVASQTQKVTYDTDVEYLVPERAGYIFLGWFEGETKHEDELWTRDSDLTLVAKWEIITYTIQYELNGGSAQNPASYQVETETFTLAAPTRTGYTFTGWTYEGQTSPIEDVTIEKGTIGDKKYTANWQANTYKITFNANGGTVSSDTITVTYDQTYTLPEPQWTGHTFTGWFNGSQKVTDGTWTQVTDIDLIATWDIIEYSITYDVNGGVNATGNPVTYTIDDQITLAEPTKTGYTFLGWTYEGQTTPIKQVVIEKGTIGDKSYTANWQANEYTLTFDVAGGSVSHDQMAVTYDQAYTLPIPEWAGHTFVGWYVDGQKILDGTWTIATNLSLVAKWDATKYEISYILNGGENASENPATYTLYDQITLANPTRTGYIFLGWTYEGQTTPVKDVTIASGTIGNKTYTANWEYNSYTITLNANGGTVASSTQDIKYGANYTIPPAIRPGYIFLGWFGGTDDNANVYTDASGNSLSVWHKMEGDTFYAHWKADFSEGLSYTKLEGSINGKKVYAYEINGIGTCTDKILRIPVEIDGIPVISVSENAFTHNTTIEEIVFPEALHKNEYDLYAHFNHYYSGVSMTSKGFLIKDNAFIGCSNLKTVTLNCVSTIGKNAFSECAILETVQIDKDSILQYIGSYSFGNCVSLQTVVIPKSCTIIDAYAFSGASQLFIYCEASSKPTNWDNQWNNTNCMVYWGYLRDGYQVTFDYDGATDNNSITYRFVEVGNSYILPVPVKTGYVFAGWYYGTTQITDANGTTLNVWCIESSCTLKAQWTPATGTVYTVKHYLQNANDNDYTLESTQTFTGTTDESISPDVKSFTHFVSPAVQTVTIAPDGSLVVNYYYDRVTYSLTYVTNGGDEIGTQTYKYGQTIVTLTPTRSGYTFGGWFTDTTLETACSATATLNEDTTIYAYWTEENKPTDFTYSGTDDITVSAYNGTSTTMWIPAYIGGVSVTTIPASAFENQTALRKVVVPDTVIEIGAGAFKGCNALENITLPFVGASKTATAYNAVFGHIFGYTRVKYGSAGGAYEPDETYIHQQYYGTTVSGAVWQYTCKNYPTNGYGYYYSCYSYYIPTTIKNVTITSQTVIPTAAFNNCDFIETIVLPNTVESISEYAFAGCSGLTSITIPDSVTSIGEGAFSGCSGLTSITLPFVGGSATVNAGEYEYPFGYIFGSKTYQGGTAIEWLYRVSGVANSTTSSTYCIPTGLTTVTITGGEILSYAFYDCANLKNINIQSEIENINYGAFFDCVGLTNVTLPNTLKTIGKSAFAGCTGLTSVVIPDSVTAINDYAFYKCTGITDIIIPDSVESIGGFAFAGCTGLTEFNIPDSVTLLGESAFKDCSGLTSIRIGTGIVDIPKSAFENCAVLTEITMDGNVVSIGEAAFKGCTNLETFALSDSVTSIGMHAFDSCINLTSISLGNSLETIGVHAFSGCTNLADVTIPDSTTSIGAYAFSGCTGMIKLTIGNGDTEIGRCAFSDCSGLTSITIGTGKVSIGESGFNNCTGLQNVTLGDGLTSIGHSAFRGCSSLTSIVIPDSVESIDYDAFAGCHSLTSITLPFVGASANPASETFCFPLGYLFGTNSYTGGVATNQSYRSLGTNNSYYSTYYIPESLKSVTVTGGIIYYGAFYNCSNLTRITIGDDVTGIVDYAFYGCSSLESVCINDLAKWCETSFQSYYANPLNYAHKLYLDNELVTDLVIPDGVTSIGEYAFSGCSSLTSITIPDSVTSIGSNAFARCTGLTSITIPDSVTFIGSGAFNNCSGLTSITIPFVGVRKDGAGSTHFGFIYGASSYQYNSSYVPASLKTVVITGGSSISSSAFYYCSNLTSITIPDSVTSIGTGAFSGCIGLTSITIPDSVTSIGEYAFNNCTGLTSITIPDSVTSIGEYAFNNCTGLTSITISDGVTSIGSETFQNCSSLTSITIPNSVTTIGKSAFSGCTNLQSISIPFVGATKDGSVSTYFGYIFGTDSYLDATNRVPSSLTTVLITDGTRINDYSFRNCTGLTSVTLPDTVISIGTFAFLDCSGLTSIVIPDSVTSIGSSAFKNCTGLKDVYVNVQAWLNVDCGDYLSRPNYYGTLHILDEDGNEVTEIIIPDSVTIIGGVFANCTGLTSITIPDSVTSIGDVAFSGCTNLTSITLPDSVTSIGGSAFAGCQGLTSIVIPDNVTSIGQSAFAGCTSLTHITVPDKVTSIGSGAFSGCSTLESITLPFVGGSSSATSASSSTVFGYIFGTSQYEGGVQTYQVYGWDCNEFVCHGLQTVCYIPTSLKTVTITGGNILFGAFYNCSGLTNIVIGNGVTKIGEYAFYKCTAIDAVIVPETVTSIDARAFDGVSQVKCAVPSKPNGWDDDWHLGASKVVWFYTGDVWDGTYAFSFEEGTGTEFDPYLIYSAEQLAYVAMSVNQGVDTFDGKYLKLTTHIHLNNLEWTPIGNETYAFAGFFDGDGYSIIGLTVNSSTLKYGGLFGRIDGGTVKNLSVLEADITLTSGHVGILCGFANNSDKTTIIFENCYVQGSVKCTSGSAAGGIVGYCSGTVNACSSNSTVESGSPSASNRVYVYVGGIAGTCTIITNCYAEGEVSSSGGSLYYHNSYVGGIVGSGETINNCYSAANITASTKADSYAGGIAGKATTINNCFSAGNITTNTYSLSGTYGGSHIGRIVGEDKDDMTVTNCYADSLQTCTRITSTSTRTGTTNDYGTLQFTHTLQTEDFILNTLGWSLDVWQINEGGFPTFKYMTGVK